MGVNVNRTKILVFTIMGLAAAFAGYVYSFGTFVVSFSIGSINPGIVAAGLTGFWTNVIYGLIIVVSVLLQAVIGRRLARSS